MAHRYHVHRHRRNPLGLNRDSFVFAAWGTAGAVGARALPAVFLSAQNTGPMGYLLNAAAALALKFAGDYITPKAGDGMLIGGLVSTGLRIVSDNFGSQIPGLSAYWPSYLPTFPAQSNPYGQMPNPQPAVIAAAAGGKGGGMSGSRFTGGRFRRN